MDASSIMTCDTSRQFVAVQRYLRYPDSISQWFRLSRACRIKMMDTWESRPHLFVFPNGNHGKKKRKSRELNRSEGTNGRSDGAKKETGMKKIKHAMLVTLSPRADMPGGLEARRALPAYLTCPFPYVRRLNKLLLNRPRGKGHLRQYLRITFPVVSFLSPLLSPSPFLK